MGRMRTKVRFSLGSNMNEILKCLDTNVHGLLIDKSGQHPRNTTNTFSC